MAFSAIDLSALPAPDVVQPLDYETIRSAMLADFQVIYPSFSASALESEPVVKLVEVAAYRELLLRQRVNDAARAVMLAFSVGSDLDHLAALFNVERLVITPANPDAAPPVAAVLESDTSLRRRTQLALEAITTAGSAGSYLFHALSASPLVKDAAIVSPTPGVVNVYVLSTAGDGVPNAPLLAAVAERLNGNTVRPLTDQVSVIAASVSAYAVTASVHVLPGPGAEQVRAAAQAAAEAKVAELHGLGRDITLSAIYAALHQPGVQKVTLTSPSADITRDGSQAAYCSGVTVTLAGVAY
jgi:phage-related baseplate assembly protein